MPTLPFVQNDGDSRVKRPAQADERTTMVAFLRWHRKTLEHKCAGLAPAQLAQRAVGRSALSLLGLVRHAAESERFWFRRVMAGQEPPPLFSSPAAPGGAFEVAGADARMVAEAWRAWQAEIAFADRLVDAAPDLGLTGNEPGEGPVSLRWVLMHMVEEYARHNGHADLLREQIDGAVGL
ncbi:DinB family protein [Nonomuraea zeae]|uniref:DinB family protein n=1 Tax=Nonomuraea zeae TaxID=1642303 RepID=A0A5S4GQC1_9ACTN|nr:DinB family protein [Nonomuraea zeae]TMR35019.1 DinB family protein [Nonomuraea zeae]